MGRQPARRCKRQHEQTQPPPAKKRPHVSRRRPQRIFLPDLPPPLLCCVWAFAPREFLTCLPARSCYISEPSQELEKSICKFVLRMARVLQSPKAQELLHSPLPSHPLPQPPRDKFYALMMRLGARVSCAISQHLRCSGLAQLLENATDAIAPLLGLSMSYFETINFHRVTIPVLTNCSSHEVLACAIRASSRRVKKEDWPRCVYLVIKPQPLSVRQVREWSRAFRWSSISMIGCDLTSEHVRALKLHRGVTEVDISNNPDVTDSAIDHLVTWVSGSNELRYHLNAKDLSFSVQGVEKLSYACSQRCHLVLWKKRYF